MPPELGEAVAQSLLVPIAATRTVLQAELVISHMIGTVRDGVEGDLEDVEEAVQLLLRDLVAPLEGSGSADALAVLRVLQVYGSGEGRDLAAEAADRMAEAGVPDRPWARRVGRPQFLRAWRYQDVFGAQTSLGVLFTDRGRDHALTVLVDHELGGGLKDAWVAEGRDAAGLRQQVMSGVAGEPAMEFADLDLAEAAQLLRDATECPPCPADPEQVDDVVTHAQLALVRAHHLCDLAGLPGPRPMGAVIRTEPLGTRDALGADRRPAVPVFRLKVVLRGIRPPIWRRLEVPADMPLSRLHRVLQVAFDWEDAHLHCFETVPVTTGAGRARRGAGGRTLEGQVLRRTRLDALVASVGDRLLYRYDFGDDWEHIIEVEAVDDAVPGVVYPRCTAGRRAGPPEDCGGWPGYEALVDALGDPSHAGHEEMRDWAPRGFDPTVFDRHAVNANLLRVL